MRRLRYVWAGLVLLALAAIAFVVIRKDANERAERDTAGQVTQDRLRELDRKTSESRKDAIRESEKRIEMMREEMRRLDAEKATPGVPPP
jgi:hypothetical protein